MKMFRMDRRKFITRATGVACLPAMALHWNNDRDEGYPPSGARVDPWLLVPPPLPDLAFSDGRSVPFGLPAFRLTVEPQVLTLTDVAAPPSAGQLRLTAALDFREELSVEVSLPVSGTSLGVLQIRYAHPFQLFQLPLSREQLRLVQQEKGVCLAVRGVEEACFLYPDQRRYPVFIPQVYFGNRPGREQDFYDLLRSDNASGPFGWIGGCVHDALLEWYRLGDESAGTALKDQLSRFLTPEGIAFHNPHTRLIKGSFNSVEDLLPLPALLAFFPDHVAVQQAAAYLVTHLSGTQRQLTTEGCYTFAYPLAALARKQQRPDLAAMAIGELRVRAEKLCDGDAIYQRVTEGAEPGFRDWGRGVVWFMLGIAKTLRELVDVGHADDEGSQFVTQQFRLQARRIRGLRRPDGLWGAYLDDHSGPPDTSASAGIAAAFAWGHHLGLLDDAYLSIARNADTALAPFLTPDGLLTGAAQINRGGEALQRSHYRVISPFALGLYAQLKAAIRHRS